MMLRKNLLRVSLATAISLVSLAAGLSEERPASPVDPAEAVTSGSLSANARPSVEVARRQAEILQRVVHSTLRSIHDRYYRADDGVPIPAAVLKDVFSDLEKEQQIRLRWLAVDGQAMNSDHKPQSPFEHAAVKALKSGLRSYEQTENAIYRRAGAITLSNHCLKCHVPDRKSTADRTAGLMIEIPIQQK